MNLRDDLAARLAAALNVERTRREQIAQAMALGALAVVATRPGSTAAQTTEASPAAGGAGLAELTQLSQTLMGGGKVDEARAQMLLEFLHSDAELSAGLDHLVASPPVAGSPIAAGSPATTAAAILTFWYAGAMNGEPVPDRETAYYQLTAWQAMYTFPGSVCRGFGAWTEEPPATPVVPANGAASA